MLETIFPSYYPYLVAGLPDLEVDSKKLPLSLADFLEEIEGLLSKKDEKLIEIFRLKFDNLNLLSCIASKEFDYLPFGNFSKERIVEWVETARKGDSLQGISIPSYIKEFLEEVFSEEGKEKMLRKEDYLSSLYYDFAMKCGNPFLAKWFEFNLNLGNVFSAQTARKYGLKVSDLIVGENEVAQRLRTSSSGKGIDLGDEVEYFDEMTRIGDLQDLYQREKETDKLKWKWLEEESKFNYLTIEQLLVFLLQTEMLERWNGLSKEKGEESFRQMIGEMKGNVRIPEELRMQ